MIYVALGVALLVGFYFGMAFMALFVAGKREPER